MLHVLLSGKVFTLQSFSFFLSTSRCFFLLFSSSFLYFYSYSFSAFVLHSYFPSPLLFHHFPCLFVLSFHSLVILPILRFFVCILFFFPTLLCFISSRSLLFFLISYPFFLPSHFRYFSLFIPFVLSSCFFPFASTVKTEQQVPSVRRHPHTRLHGVKTYMTTI
jgi:hypothetical protein